MLITIAFMLIGLAFFRTGASQASAIGAEPAPVDPNPLFHIIAGSIVIALAAMEGGFCGYLRVLSRLRKNSELQDSDGAARKT